MGKPAVFPAHAGMSPGLATLLAARKSFPRTRGDEPRPVVSVVPSIEVFPAHAGMSPRARMKCHVMSGFPRTRGDEPRIL